MSRYLGVLGMQMRTSISQAMAYRANFLIQIVISLAWVGIALLPLIVIYDKRDSVAGWDRPSALVVMGYFMGIRAVLEGIVTPSLIGLVEKIRSGSFDYVLLKPMDAQFMVSAHSFAVEKVFDLLAAIGLVVYAFYDRGHAPSADQLALGIVLFVAGVLAMYSLWIICAAASFWVVRLDNLIYLLGAIFDTARWPVQVFKGLWRIIFTFVIPVAVMTTFPAMALLGRLDAKTAIATFAGAAAMLVIGRLVWMSAIRNYTSASS
jgi:ABC-2 type transport system permease protein